MPPEFVIRSRQNPAYKQIRSLLRRDRRHQERAFLVEGPRFIADAIAHGASPSLLVFAESATESIARFEDPGTTSRIIDDALFDSLADTVTSQGVVAVFPFPDRPEGTSGSPLVVMADGIQDPGNLGTLIRSAAGAGATQVIALPGTVDPWAPKTVRAAAAAHFLVPITTQSIGEAVASLPADCLLIAADASGSVRYDECDLTGPIVLVVGGEGHGLSKEVFDLDPLLVSIPLQGGLESLNAGVAGSIILFEAARQRRNSTKLAKMADSI
jgi:TrmH family RNA methyltransferase